jgi:HEAT repeat protein
LGVIGSEAVVPALLEALKDKGWEVPDYAAAALSQIKVSVLASALPQVLNHKKQEVRRKAVEIIGYYVESKKLAEDLQRLSTEDPSDEVRAAAADASARYLRKLRVLGKEAQSIEAAEEIGRARTLEETRRFISHEVTQTIEPLKDSIGKLTEKLERAELDQDKLAEAADLLRRKAEEAAAIASRFDEFTRKPQADAEHEALIRARYAEVLRLKNSHEKGRALEALAAALFASIAGFIEAKRNALTASEEIDVLIRNESRDPFWSPMGQWIFIECKNWRSKRVGKDEFTLFLNKIRNRKPFCRLGFLFCTAAVARTIRLEMVANRGSGLLVVPLNDKDLRALVESDNRNSWNRRRSFSTN